MKHAPGPPMQRATLIYTGRGHPGKTTHRPHPRRAAGRKSKRI